MAALTVAPDAHPVPWTQTGGDVLPSHQLAEKTDGIDLRQASIVVRANADPVERTAATVLQQEVRKRTALDWAVTFEWPSSGVAIAIIARPAGRAWGRDVPRLEGAAARPEGYRVVVDATPARPVVWAVASEPPAAMFAIGELLRRLDWAPNHARLSGSLDVSTSPRYPLRGHQLGYRHHSNTYDGWTVEQYDQYVRELALFGANAIENIPFQDARPSPVMPVPRSIMSRRVSEICARYGVQHWLWTPAEIDLGDKARRGEALEALERLFADLPRLDGVFLPGGDPGDNPARLVVPYLQDLNVRLARHHPRAKVWLSLQRFDDSDLDFIFAWIDRELPAWLGGLVAGPGSYPIPQTRARLNPKYPLRDYPDITHTARSQYPVPWWDPAFAFTLGREPINPRPVFYAKVHDRLAPYTDGFITYSDGVNDDVNKVLWTRKGWDPGVDVRDVLREYARVFFAPRLADRAADGLLALERNWEGPLDSNGAVDGTLALWRELEASAPELGGNWRWQMALLRAHYDAYTRHRLIDETALEAEANRALAAAPRIGASAAMDRAMAILNRAAGDGCCPEWRRRIEGLADALFASIRMQSSVTKHHASGYERGAVLDFVDHPLNNRWWLEDEFEKIRALPDERARLVRVEELRTWADPGPGSFYDDVGHVGRSPRVRRGDSASGDRPSPHDPIPHFTWEGGPTRTRLSWLTSLRWPAGIVYEPLDAQATYVLRLNGPGAARVRLDAEPAEPTRRERALGPLTEYRVPSHLLRDGRLVVTFDPVDERHLNWRQHSRLAEIWLLKVRPGQ